MLTTKNTNGDEAVVLCNFNFLRMLRISVHAAHPRRCLLKLSRRVAQRILRECSYYSRVNVIRRDNNKLFVMDFGEPPFPGAREPLTLLLAKIDSRGTFKRDA
jgi:hypothetical protein